MRTKEVGDVTQTSDKFAQNVIWKAGESRPTLGSQKTLK
jgi:hypothetical protein